MMNALRTAARHLDKEVGRSTFGRVFRLEGCGHNEEIAGATLTREVRAGLTTFFTMAYIIAVNASIISQTGGTCVCDDAQDSLCSTNAEYAQCILGIQRDLITATAAISALGSFLFGFLTNLPVALAPGMGLNAYFTYQVVGFHGGGSVPYRLALTAVFVEGFIFIFLSLIGMRQWLVKLVPASLKIAATAGIGLFLTLIGLSTSAGVGLISGASSTPLDLAGCLPQYKDAFGECQSHKLGDPRVWIGVCCGGMVTGILMMYRVKGAIFYGIALVSIMSWPRGTSFTAFPYTADGQERFDFFKKVVGFHPIQNTLVANDWNLSTTGPKFALALFTFLYVDILDSTGTLYSMARFAGVVDVKNSSFPRSTIAYCTDAFCISMGSLFGVSPVTTFVESGAGIAEGGRTGLTAMTTGLCFLISVFFAPIFASIPQWATGCALIVVGWMMTRSVVDINWKYAGDSLPAFVTLIFIPFSYSIAYGLIAGIMTYVIVNGTVYIIKAVSFGRIRPVNEDSREYWTYKWHGGTLPWFVRVTKYGYHTFWHDYTHESLSEGQAPPVMVNSSNYDSRSSSIRDVEAVEVPELKVDRALTALP